MLFAQYTDVYELPATLVKKKQRDPNQRGKTGIQQMNTETTSVEAARQNASQRREPALLTWPGDGWMDICNFFSFLTALTKYSTKATPGRRVYRGSHLEGVICHGWDSTWWRKYAASGHGKQEDVRVGPQPAFCLSPSNSVWAPILGNGAPHILGASPSLSEAPRETPSQAHPEMSPGVI